LSKALGRTGNYFERSYQLWLTLVSCLLRIGAFYPLNFEEHPKHNPKQDPLEGENEEVLEECERIER
jgi:hypothetical protein